MIIFICFVGMLELTPTFYYFVILNASEGSCQTINTASDVRSFTAVQDDRDINYVASLKMQTSFIVKRFSIVLKQPMDFQSIVVEFSSKGII